MFTIIGGDGKEYGPATVDQLRAWINNGRANLDTKAKALGTEEWRRLGDFAEFATPDAPPQFVSASSPATAPTVFPTQVPSAGLGVRFGAGLIDGFATMLCRIPMGIAMMGTMRDLLASGGQPDVMALMAAISEASKKSYPFLIALAAVQCVLISMRGQSLGKVVCGTRIVKVSDGTKVGFLHGFLLRGTVPFVIELIPLLGFLFWIVDSCFIFGEEKRCVHDYIAGTRVVKAD